MRGVNVSCVSAIARGSKHRRGEEGAKQRAQEKQRAHAPCCSTTRGIYQAGIGLMIPRRSTHQGHISSRNQDEFILVDDG